jgi:hypothetical protein
MFLRARVSKEGQTHPHDGRPRDGEEVSPMRRMLLTAGAALALSLAPAGAAMAHGHSHHARHHARRHHAHIVRFVSHTTTTSSPSAPAGTPPATEEVATVASFTGGVLTLKLADGSTVSGKVTEDTRIECPAAGEEQQDADDNGQGDDNGGPGPSGFGGAQGDDMSGPSDNGSGDDDGQGDDDQEQQPCGTSALVEGAKVAEAELRVGAGGATWLKVELLG